jgi:hypothetical protein
LISAQAQNLCHVGVPEVPVLLQPERINAVVQMDLPILRPKSAAGHQILTDDLWDPWPDGDFGRSFTWEEVTKTNNLSEHWACQPH